MARVLFTDIVASTERLAAGGDEVWRKTLDDHDRATDRLVARYRGRVVKSTGDGILATFDGPARAVRCAAEIVDAADEQGIRLRAGLHTGEIEIRPTDVTGIAVHTANRISALAEAGEILVSRTVVDLTAGSGLQFEARGEHQLKGVPGTWSTFAAVPSPCGSGAGEVAEIGREARASGGVGRIPGLLLVAGSEGEGSWAPSCRPGR